MPKRYSKAPIIEAVIDFQVELPVGVSVDALQSLKSDLQHHFPAQENFNVATARLEIAGGPASSIVQEIRGFRFVSEDKRKVLVMSTRSFTFSHLAPYDSWDTFSHEARENWDRYKAVARPLAISRVGVRYINRIDIPIAHGINAYLKLRPSIPLIPNRPSLGFFMQLQVPQPDIESMLIINEGRVDSPNPEILSVLLDIDVFREHRWEAQSDESVWQFLNELRSRKNEVFEASITQKTKELIA